MNKIRMLTHARDKDGLLALSVRQRARGEGHKALVPRVQRHKADAALHRVGLAHLAAGLAHPRGEQVQLDAHNCSKQEKTSECWSMKNLQTNSKIKFCQWKV